MLREALRAPGFPLLAVCGLTLLAFALRVGEIGQSLFGDELILFRAVHDRGLGDVLRIVHDTESTPPLHFVLAWGTAKIGDPTSGIVVGRRASELQRARGAG